MFRPVRESRVRPRSSLLLRAPAKRYPIGCVILENDLFQAAAAHHRFNLRPGETLLERGPEAIQRRDLEIGKRRAPVEAQREVLHIQPRSLEHELDAAKWPVDAYGDRIADRLPHSKPHPADQPASPVGELP